MPEPACLPGRPLPPALERSGRLSSPAVTTRWRAGIVCPGIGQAGKRRRGSFCEGCMWLGIEFWVSSFSPQRKTRTALGVEWRNGLIVGNNLDDLHHWPCGPNKIRIGGWGGSPQGWEPLLQGLLWVGTRFKERHGYQALELGKGLRVFYTSAYNHTTDAPSQGLHTPHTHSHFLTYTFLHSHTPPNTAEHRGSHITHPKYTHPIHLRPALSQMHRITPKVIETHRSQPVSHPTSHGSQDPCSRVTSETAHT